MSAVAKRQKPHWIKERDNPQLGVYYVRCGQLSKTAASSMEDSLYGCNIMHSYPDEKSYLQAIEDLKREGARIR